MITRCSYRFKNLFLKTYESLSESNKWSTWVVHSQGWNSKKLTGIRTSGGTCGLIRQYARNLTWTRMPLTVAEMWFSFETKCKVLHARRQLVPWGVRLSPVTSATLMFSYQRVMAGTLARLPWITWRKVGMTSNHHAPYDQGYTRATMAENKEKRKGDLEQISEKPSQFGL